jgi:hypothetical protein
MACNDFGIALLPTSVVHSDLIRGTLVHVMPRFQTISEDFYSVYPSHRQRSRAVQAFIDFMTAWMRTHNVNMEALRALKSEKVPAVTRPPEASGNPAIEAAHDRKLIGNV